MTKAEQRSNAGSWKRTDDRPPVASPIEPTHYEVPAAKNNGQRGKAKSSDNCPSFSPIEPTHYVKEMNTLDWNDGFQPGRLQGTADLRSSSPKAGPPIGMQQS